MRRNRWWRDSLLTRFAVSSAVRRGIILGEASRGAGSGGERRRWDSNPRGLFTLHDFQSCSLGHYETPPALFIFRSATTLARSTEWAAERVGFEPTRAIHPTAFRERHFRPLRHLSAAQYSISPGVRQATVAQTQYSATIMHC